jgi:predicted ATPase
MQLLHAVARRRLVLLIVEDLQWIDASTIELLGQLAKQPGLSNIFALFTFRSEFTVAWPAHAHLTRINLNRLTRRQSGQMIHELCQHKRLPDEVFNDIINKTDGIPFFIEELTHALLESGQMDEQAERFTLKAPVSEMGIPSTLQDLLMARLDSLGQEKSLAQISAILGREFEHEVLRTVASRDEQSFGRGLDNLISAELFLQHGQRPKAWYRFRHALLREAAYHSLLKRTRQKYHQRIASLMREHFPQMVQENPELLAHHYTEAGEPLTALEYWLKAGHQAMQHSANVEAINHLNRGLSVLQTLPESAQRHAQELSLQTCLGQAYMMTRGYAAAEVQQAYARAKALCADIHDIGTVFPVLCGLWEYYVVRAELDTALDLALEIHSLAQQADNPALRIEALRALGTSQLWRGRLREAWQYLQPKTLIEQLQDQQGPEQLLSYYQDPRVAMLSNSACVLWLCGYPQQAMENARQALSLAKQLAHPFSQVYALNFLCTLSQLNGDRASTADYAELQIMLCQTHGFAFWGAMGLMFQAWANLDKQPHEHVLRQFQEALHNYEQIGSRIARSYFLAMLAGLLLETDNFQQASATIDEALQEISASGEAFFKAELLRIKGELLLARTTPAQDAAETVLFQALEEAREQGSHALALRIAASLADLWRQQGKTAQAKDLLQSQLRLVTEEEDIMDQLRAQQLIQACTPSA